MSSRTVVMILAATLASSAAVPAAMAAPPPPEYAMVELSGLAVGGGFAKAYHCSETRPVLRAVGYVDGGTWINEGGGTCNTKHVPAYWDVAGTTSPVAPVVLPLARPDKPAWVWDSSRDGGSLAGSAWIGDNASCGISMRPVIWEQGAGGWTATYLPIPPGYSSRGTARSVTDGASMVFGTVNWPEIRQDGTTREVARGCIWRRNPEDGSFSTEILTNTCWGCDSLKPWFGGVRYSGTVAAAAVWESMDDNSGARTPRYWEDVGGTWAGHDLPLLSDAITGWAETGDSNMFFGSSSSAMNGVEHGVVWETASSPARDLGSLDGATGRSIALDQNGLGLTVGSSTKVVQRQSTDRAVRWTPPSWTLVDLNTKANTNGAVLTYATGVDAARRIVGYAKKTTRGVPVENGFALIPIN